MLAPIYAQAPEVRVEIEGISGVLKDNVETLLSIRRAGDEATTSRVQRLHSRAEAEIQLALQPFGYYEPSITASLEHRDDAWIARYSIDPGRIVLVDAVDIEISGAGQDNDQIQEAVEAFPLTAASELDHTAYELGKRAILSRAISRGYLDAAYDTSEVRVDLDDHTADIVLFLSTGPRYLFGPVTFNQDILDERVLMGFVPFERGDSLSTDSLVALQAALAEGPYFQRVELLPRRDLVEGLEVPIEVNLTPRQPQRYEIGVGYGTDTGPRGTISTELRRLNRRGHRAEGAIRASTIERAASARYIIPAAYPSTNILSFFTGYTFLNPTTSHSERLRLGTGVNRLRGRWQEAFTLAYERESFVVGSDSGVSDLVLLGAGWTRTRADNRVYTTRGFRVRFAGSGSLGALPLTDVDMARATLNAKLIRAVGGSSRLIARAEVGALFTTGFRKLPPSLRFFAGGDQSVRGYAYQSLGPSDSLGTILGGDGLVTASVEFERRVHNNWGVAVFFDTGNAITLSDFSLEQGVGAGIRWLSPVGQIRLDGAFGISEPGTNFRIHIAIGPDL